MSSRKQFTYSPIPEWHETAKCARPGADARQYDLGRTGERRADTMVRAAIACFGCPVIHECARDAVEEHSVGVVRGGLPCPEQSWLARGSVGQDALEAVGRGDNALAVATYTAARHDATAPAVERLAALATWNAPPLEWTPPAADRAPRG